MNFFSHRILYTTNYSSILVLVRFQALIMSAPGAGKTRGGKKKIIHHKGGNRRFTDFEELKAQAAEIKNMKNRDEDSDEDDSKFHHQADKVRFNLTASEGTGSAGPAVAPPKKLPIAKKREDSSSDEESSGDDDADDDSDNDKHKGVTHLIEVENPNRVKQKMKKVTDLKLENTELSRKEREAIEKERKKQEYQRLHALGKTDEAQADLARLQIIRKQREDAAKKREEEKLAKEKAGKEQQASKLAGGIANMKL